MSQKCVLEIILQIIRAIVALIVLLLVVTRPLSAASYDDITIFGSYGDPFTRIFVRFKNLKVNEMAKPRNVAFELHSHRNYRSKIYLEVNGNTFGYGTLPTAITYKKRGDYYIHGNNGDPVPVQRVFAILDDENKMILRSICQFVADKANADMIFDTVIRNSSGDAKSYWQRYRNSMDRDIRTVGRYCWNKIGGKKISLVKSVGGASRDNTATICGFSNTTGLLTGRDFRKIQTGFSNVGYMPVR